MADEQTEQEMTPEYRKAKMLEGVAYLRNAVKEHAVKGPMGPMLRDGVEKLAEIFEYIAKHETPEKEMEALMAVADKIFDGLAKLGGPRMF